MKSRKQQCNIEVALTIEFDEVEMYIAVEDVPVNHWPERPMPPCQDPSDPRYCDPGDPEESEFDDLDELEKQLREEFERIITGLRTNLEYQIENIGEIDIHELLPEKGEKQNEY